jgi:hypothetical protein
MPSPMQSPELKFQYHNTQKNKTLKIPNITTYFRAIDTSEVMFYILSKDMMTVILNKIQFSQSV